MRTCRKWNRRSPCRFVGVFACQYRDPFAHPPCSIVGSAWQLSNVQLLAGTELHLEGDKLLADLLGSAAVATVDGDTLSVKLAPLQYAWFAVPHQK